MTISKNLFVLSAQLISSLCTAGAAVRLTVCGAALLSLSSVVAQAQASQAQASQSQNGPTQSGPTQSGPTQSGPTQSGPTQSGQAQSSPLPPQSARTLPSAVPSVLQPTTVSQPTVLQPTQGAGTPPAATSTGAVFTLPGMSSPSLLPVPTVTVTTTPAATLPSITVPNITVPPEVVPVVMPSTPPNPPGKPASPASVHAAQPSNMRGLWVDAFGPGLKTPTQVRQMVTDAAALGVNTLFVQTIRRADCLCNLANVPRAADRDLAPGFDPLAEVITLAHAHNIRVIAWVSVTGAGSSNAPNPSPLHVLQQHGPAAGVASWVNRRADGSYLEGGDIWLDAGIPAASDFMAQSILSLVKNYNIDGIQFDRIRYPDGGNWGYSPQALARYRAETHAAGTPLPSDPRWTDWKRQQITALVRRVALETRVQKPELWITAATITYGAPPTDLTGFQKSRTYNDVVQDWPTWAMTGLLDLNVLMNYKQDAVPNHIQWFDGWNAFAISVAGQGEAAAGAALYLNTPQVSRDQYLRATALGMGWVGYAYRTPTLDVYKNGTPQPQGFEELRQKLTAPEKTLNVGPWTATPPQRYGVLGHIRGPLLPGGRTVEAYSAAGTLLASTQTDGNGYYGFAALPPGIVDVRVEGQHWQQALVRPGVAKLPDILLLDTKLTPARVLPVLSPAALAPATLAPTTLAPTSLGTATTAAQPANGQALQGNQPPTSAAARPAQLNTKAPNKASPVKVPSPKAGANVPKVPAPKVPALKTPAPKVPVLVKPKAASKLKPAPAKKP